MRERASMDPFEQALAAGLDRFVAPAVDRRTAGEIADVAMRPRDMGTRVRNATGPRRWLLLGVAALLVIPAASLGVGRLLEVTRPSIVAPEPPAVPAPTSVPGPSGLEGEAADPVALLVRRHEGDAPGISVFAARADGSEALVRTLPDTAAPGGRWLSWGYASADGWIALTVDAPGSWPVVLLDLGDPASQPWVVDEADIGGIGPRWGPTGLLAAPAAGQRDSLVIADPGTRTTRLMPLQGYSLVGGGPSIVWSSDGFGIVGVGEALGDGDGYVVLPLDGGAPRAAVGAVSDPFDRWGADMATLEICLAGIDGCEENRVDRVEVGGARRTIWRQDGPDRALAAAFGDRPDEYWITVDHDAGRQVQVVRVADGRSEVVATVNRDAAWGYVGAVIAAADGADTQLWLGLVDGIVAVPAGGGAATVHGGDWAGLVDTAALAGVPGFERAGSPVPATGEPFRLPPVDELVKREQALNPGRVVLGSASYEAVAGDTTVRTVAVPTTQAGGGDVYLDCIGPSPVTVTSGGGTVTSPCLSDGSYVMQASGPITVTASGDTSWRVIVYTAP